MVNPPLVYVLPLFSIDQTRTCQGLVPLSPSTIGLHKNLKRYGLKKVSVEFIVTRVTTALKSEKIETIYYTIHELLRRKV
ncbi:MAG: hypothetical protein AYK19_01115 [Theionarchaea archaeon DG-70-1]|nr:MAG: hypothetical protein AYK19_01115 [Theionarchaea archaeon DG-70-1]